MCAEETSTYSRESSTGNSSANGPDSMTTGDIVQIVVATLGVFFVLVYPLCFLTLMAQIANTHDYDYVMARYAASLAPSSLVAAKIIFISIYSCIAGLIMVAIYRIVGSYNSRWRYLAPTAIVTMSIAPVLGLPELLGLSNPLELRMHALFEVNAMYVALSDTFLYALCVSATVVGALVACKVCSEAGRNPYSLLPWKGSFWENTNHTLGVGVIYLGALIAGVSFSAIHGHNLPEIRLYLKGEDPNNPREAYMLSVSNETWYVIDADQPFLLAIPADGVEGMDTAHPAHDPVLPLKSSDSS